MSRSACFSSKILCVVICWKETACLLKARVWPRGWQIPGPRAAKNLLMPHPWDWQGGQMPRSSPEGGGAGRSWNWLMHKRIDKSIIIFCILSWFRDYPQRDTQGYRSGFSVVTSLLVFEYITRQWNIDISFTYLLFFSEKMNLINKSNAECSNTFRSFLMMNLLNEDANNLSLSSTCIRVTIIWIKILLWKDLGFLLLCSNLACSIITSATKTNLKY